MPFFPHSPRAKRLALVHSVLLVVSALVGTVSGVGTFAAVALALAADPTLDTLRPP